MGGAAVGAAAPPGVSLSGVLPLVGCGGLLAELGIGPRPVALHAVVYGRGAIAVPVLLVLLGIGAALQGGSFWRCGRRPGSGAAAYGGPA